MHRLFIHWALSALALGIVSQLVPGFVVTGIAPAFIAAIVIGFINATLGFFLKMVTLPLTIMTLGLCWFIINAMMLEFASNLVQGFYVQSFAAAFLGGIVLSLVNIVLKFIFLPRQI